MIRQIVLVSGPVGAGKTTLCEQLVQSFGAVHFKSRIYLRNRLTATDPATPRDVLQDMGNKLDRKTKGAWIVDGLREVLHSSKDAEGEKLVLVDAVRIKGQIEAVRKAYGDNVVHIHVTAPLVALADRYVKRQQHSGKQSDVKELGTYDDVRKDPTEKKVDQLAHIADIVIDTKLNTKLDVLVRAASHLGLYGRGTLRLCDVLIGGQFGSEGKGQIAAYLANDYDYLVRVGGPNAGHTVYAQPEHYKYHHLPSGTRHSRAKIIIGAGAVINVEGIQKEIAECRVEKGRLFIDPQATIIDKADGEAEKKLMATIGSTGQGVGAATARRIMGRGEGVRLAKDVDELRPFVQGNTRDILDLAFRNQERVFLEGTQGTGLSLYHGSYPYVTSRDTTVAGCLAEAGIAPSRVRKVIMVCRTYPIRVEDPPHAGKTSGPMSQEISLETIAERSGIDLEELQVVEKTTTTKRKRRIGEFDWNLLRDSARLNGPTDIALTFVDYHTIENRNARRFEQLHPDTIRFIEEVEKVAGAPVSLISTRFHSRSVIDRRAW